MKKKNFKKLTIALLACLTCVGAFAWLSDSAVSNKKSDLSAGIPEIKFVNEANTVTLTDNAAIPMTDVWAASHLTPFTYNLENTGDIDLRYTVYVDADSVETTFAPEKVKLMHLNSMWNRYDCFAVFTFANGDRNTIYLGDLVDYDPDKTVEQALAEAESKIVSNPEIIGRPGETIEISKAEMFVGDEYVLPFLNGDEGEMFSSIYSVEDLEHITAEDALKGMLEDMRANNEDLWGRLGYETVDAALAGFTVGRHLSGQLVVKTEMDAYVITLADALDGAPVTANTNMFLAAGQMGPEINLYVYLDESVELSDYTGNAASFNLKVEAEQAQPVEAMFDDTKLYAAKEGMGNPVVLMPGAMLNTIIKEDPYFPVDEYVEMLEEYNGTIYVAEIDGYYWFVKSPDLKVIVMSDGGYDVHPASEELPPVGTVLFDDVSVSEIREVTAVQGLIEVALELWNTSPELIRC